MLAIWTKKSTRLALIAALAPAVLAPVAAQAQFGANGVPSAVQTVAGPEIGHADWRVPADLNDEDRGR